MRDVQGSATEKLKMFEKVRAAGGFAKGDLADHAEAERMLRDFVRWRRGMPKGGEPVPLYRKTPLASATLRLSYLSTMRLSSLRLWPAMAAISGTVQPAPAIRVTHVSSAVMDGQTRDASLDRFPMEHPAKAVRFPRFAVALQGLPSGKGAARMGPTFPQSIIRCYFHPSLPAQRSIRWCFAITNMGAGPRLTGRFLRAERRPRSS